MIFTHHPNTGEATLIIEAELFTHLIRTRRHKIGDKLWFSALNNTQTHYVIMDIFAKKAMLSKLKTQDIDIVKPKYLHLAWCVVDSNIIKNFLPCLNQLGLAKITFVMADRSQKYFKPNLEKLNNILIHSCQQCGRYDLMTLDFAPSIDTFIRQYPDTILVNFSGKNITEYQASIQTIMIGAEGGFSPREVALFLPKNKICLSNPYVLKSENAAICVVNSILT